MTRLLSSICQFSFIRVDSLGSVPIRISLISAISISQGPELLQSEFSLYLSNFNFMGLDSIETKVCSILETLDNNVGWPYL